MTDKEKTQQDKFWDAFLAAQRECNSSFRKSEGVDGDAAKNQAPSRYYAPADVIIPVVRLCLHNNGLVLSFWQEDAMNSRYPCKSTAKGSDEGGDTVVVKCCAGAFGFGHSHSVGAYSDLFGSAWAGTINRHQSCGATITYTNRQLAVMLMGATTGDRDYVETSTDEASGSQKADANREEYQQNQIADLHDYVATSKLGATPEEIHGKVNFAYKIAVKFLADRDGSPEERKVADFFVRYYNPEKRGQIVPTAKTMDNLRAIATKYKLIPEEAKK